MPVRLSLVVSLLIGSPLAAFSIRPGGLPKSWQATSPNGRFEFAMIATYGADDFPSGTTATERQTVADLRRRCPRAGVYRTDTGACLWTTTEQFGFERYTGGATTLVSDNGEWVVWLSAVPAARPARQSALDRWWNGESQYFLMAPVGDFHARKDQPAVRILGRGRHAAFTHANLIRDPEKLPKMVPFAVSWVESADITGTELHVTTNDDQRLIFDLTTGELIRRRGSAGLSGWWWLSAVAVLSTAGVWLARCRVKCRATDRMPATS